MSRSTIYRYLDLGLLEPAGSMKKQLYFIEEHVAIVRTIQRLLGPDFRFRLSEIKELVFPEFSWSEIAKMPSMSSSELRRLLGRKRILTWVGKAR